jgi:hypothetical protein
LKEREEMGFATRREIEGRDEHRRPSKAKEIEKPIQRRGEHEGFGGRWRDQALKLLAPGDPKKVHGDRFRVSRISGFTRKLSETGRAMSHHCLSILRNGELEGLMLRTVRR